jgi:hypothetical protein
MATNRLIDYFAVYGLSEDQPLEVMQSPNPLEDFSDSKGNSDLNIISDLRLRVTAEDETISSYSEFFQFFELAEEQGQKLWLEVEYGRIGAAVRPEWDGRMVKGLGLFFVPFESKYTMVPQNVGMAPVPVLDGSTEFKLRGKKKGYLYFTGNYDVTAFLGAKPTPQRKLVLLFGYVTADTDLPLVSVQLVASEDQVMETGEHKKLARIPDNYEFLNFPLGRTHDSFLCYKAQRDSLLVTYKAHFIEQFPRVDLPDTPLNQAIHMFCFPDNITLTREQTSPQAHSFIMTTVEGSSGKVPRIYVTVLTFYEPLAAPLAQQLRIKTDACNKVYMPKAICLVSHWPYIDNYREILKQIYRLHISSTEIPLERIICNLVQEVPLPDQGVTSVQYDIGNYSIVFSRPPPKYFPLVQDKCFEFLFRALRFDDVIILWSCVMLERKLLLISVNKSLLTYAALAISALIFPFKWDQILIPILPRTLKDYVAAIFPYIIGVHPSLLNDDVTIPGDAVRVELDTGRIYMLEPLPRLPDKPRRQLQARLQQCANIYQPEDALRITVDEAFDTVYQDSQQSRRFDVLEVRDAFLELQSHLLKNYHRYLLIPTSAQQRFNDARECFNMKGFLQHHKAKGPENFLSQLVETSLFAAFIEARCFEAASSYELMYFDEAMRFKRTRADPRFVKPYRTNEAFLTLGPNDIGFDIDKTFKYDCFPRLNDHLFVEPRKVRQLAVSQAPKPVLLLKDEVLQKMNQGDWAKFLLMTIYRLWFMSFAANLHRFIDKADNLMDLAVHFLEQMKKRTGKQDEEIYRRLIEACGRCGLKPRVLFLFKHMKNQGIEPDASTHGAYVKAVAEGTRLAKKVDHLATEFPPESLCMNLHLENCVFLTSDICPTCTFQMDHQEIMQGWERSYSNYTTTCSNARCGASFVPRFTVIVDRQDFLPSEAQAASEVLDEIKVEAEFLSPPLLRKELENVLYSKGEALLVQKDFCETYKLLFWNLILNFDLAQLPTFFLDPNFDADNIEDIKKRYLSKRREAPTHRLQESSVLRRNLSTTNLSDAESVSDTSSVSSVISSASHNGVLGSKVSRLMNTSGQRSRSKKSSVGSDVQSTTSSTSKNQPIKKLFGQLIEDFKTEHRKRGRRINLKQEDEF